MSWGELSKFIDRAKKQSNEAEEMEALSEGLEEVHVDDLTKAQVNEICADLLAKAAKDEEGRSYNAQFNSCPFRPFGYDLA